MTEPRILLYDIETLPNVGWFWQARTDYIRHDQLLWESEAICFGAKWYGDDFTYWWREEDMWSPLGEMMAESDAVVTFNGDKFDRRRMNQENAKRRLPVLAKPMSIDLSKVVRREFGLYSNSLAYTLKYFGLPHKGDSGGSKTWIDILKPRIGLSKPGNREEREAWKTMEQYNRLDVERMEPLLDFLRPYLPPSMTLNRNFDVGEEGCPSCGSQAFKPQGFRYNAAGTYQRYVCGDCGRWFQDGRAVSRANKR